jgi:formylglycine-generating enzyme required for sulfatase activity
MAQGINTNPPPLTNLVWIPSGGFVMNRAGVYNQPNVYISRSYWMGRFEVTQGEYIALMTNNPSAFTNSLNLPVESVTWNEAVLYCNRLNAREQTAGRLPAGWSYRLPTEAEWEYACRAGTIDSYYFGDGNAINRLPFFAWVGSNSGGVTHDVGGRAPNGWGLYDMYGNVREWCSDWYGSLPGGNLTDPKGPSSAEVANYRVARGSGFGDGTLGANNQPWGSARYFGNAHSSHLDGADAGSRSSSRGFRVVLAPNP